MYEIDYVAHVGQHIMTATHPHYRAIYENLPDGVRFKFAREEINPDYNKYINKVSKVALDIGAKQKGVDFFIKNIHEGCSNQPKANLCFVPTHPYFGPEKHIINLEHWTSYYTYLVSEYVGNGLEVPIDDVEWGKVVISVMLQENFSYLCSHMHDTIETFYHITKDFPQIKRKFVYLPLASPESQIEKEPKKFEKNINLLFTNSYGGQIPNFIIRGGNETFNAALHIMEKYHIVTLTSIGPCPLINHPRVRQYQGHIEDEVFNQIIDDTHILLIPAMRIHSISLVKALCNGIIPIVSDGWGFDEYIQDGYNGFIVEGQKGYTTWKDENNIFQEDGGKKPSAELAFNIAKILEFIVQNPYNIEDLSKNCLDYAKDNFNIENRNKILLNMIKESYD